MYRAKQLGLTETAQCSSAVVQISSHPTYSVNCQGTELNDVLCE